MNGHSDKGIKEMGINVNNLLTISAL